jgi:hypothetical protein
VQSSSTRKVCRMGNCSNDECGSSSHTTRKDVETLKGTARAQMPKVRILADRRSSEKEKKKEKSEEDCR